MSLWTDQASPDVQLRLESILLETGDHVGVFYRGDEERDAFVLPLIGEALAAGCGVIYVADRDPPDEVKERLLAEAIDVEGAIRSGQMELVASTDAYLAGGRFDPDRMVAFYRRACEGSRRRGYPVLCVVGEMSWSLRDCPGTERLVEYEALYARQFWGTPTITLCLYDLEQTRGEQIFDLLRIHGRIVLNGIEVRNPHRIHPGSFLSGIGVER